MSTTATAPPTTIARQPRRWLILFLVWAAFMMTSLDRSVWGPAASSVGQALSVSVASLGVFATCYYVGYVVSNFLGGVASDWIGPRAILVASMVMAGLGMNLFGNVDSMMWGLAAQGFVGFFAGADFSAGAKSISNWFSGAERTFAVSLYTTATSLGTVIANLVVPTMIKGYGWRLSYHLFGGISIGLGLLILLLHRNHPQGAEPTAVGKLQAPPVGEVFRNRDLVILAIAGFFGLWGTCISNFLPEQLSELAKTWTVVPAVNQIECHPSFQNVAAADASAAQGIAVEAYSPLGQGKDLSADAVKAAADAHGVTAGQVILRWHLHHGRIVIPKSTTPERVKANLDVVSFELTADELAAIDALESGDRCTWDPAVFDWPQTGPIPKGWKPGMGASVPN